MCALSQKSRRGPATISGMPAPPPNPAAEKAAFLASHVYSTAAEADPKRRIDEALMGGDFANRAKIDMDDGEYLKQLIYLATGGRRVVRDGREGAAVLHDQGRRRGLPAASLPRHGCQPGGHRRRRHDRQLGRRGHGLRQQRPAGGVRRRWQAARLGAAPAAHLDHRSQPEAPAYVDGRHSQQDLRRLGRQAGDALSQQELRHRLLRPDDQRQARLVHLAQCDGRSAQAGDDERLHLHRRSRHAAIPDPTRLNRFEPQLIQGHPGP